MTDSIVDAVVIGLGNRYRRDDGVGIVVADQLDRLGLNGVRVVTDIMEPMSLLEAWSGAGLAVVIDGAVGRPPAPGRVRRCALSDVTAGDRLSSHGIDLVRTHALGDALGRVPGELVLLTVEVADTGHGAGLTPPVARAVAEVVNMALAEILPDR
ncbi:peptidase M52 [Mycobacterium sp. 852002-50816_SCH5313054-b]|uniref:hydrogenase maturation protease n=1 Tax=Mycobacterium sp. 852002-50816_SCH5313054-b TaxID=1834092 RepID=UPI0007FD5FB0|nr:hydrogenase maturation protease [Mycobacterium sp. 852002-50816_SCH5313054-b]OBF47175.1 peptidase M52 [Mycobacterium sp. 852002-50816_SCH5313054-b]